MMVRLRNSGEIMRKLVLGLTVSVITGCGGANSYVGDYNAVSTTFKIELGADSQEFADLQYKLNNLECES